MTNCKICGSESTPCFNALILNKYDTVYYKCTHCGFIQTDAPYWLQEAYGSAITKQDIGLINRNLVTFPILSLLINYFFDKARKFIDYGGGYGMLTRIMRDKGYDYYRFDTYCENIFAKNFDAENPGTSPDYELLTAFEVFEHLEDPSGELEKMLNWSSNIFFSTEIQPANVNSPADWWYVMPETGQHIALYTIKALQALGKKHGFNFYTNGTNLHLFTRKKINSWLFKLIMKYRAAKVLNLFTPGNGSYLMKDFALIKSQ